MVKLWVWCLSTGVPVLLLLVAFAVIQLYRLRTAADRACELEGSPFSSTERQTNGVSKLQIRVLRTLTDPEEHGITAPGNRSQPYRPKRSSEIQQAQRKRDRVRETSERRRPVSSIYDSNVDGGTTDSMSADGLSRSPPFAADLDRPNSWQALVESHGTAPVTDAPLNTKSGNTPTATIPTKKARPKPSKPDPTSSPISQSSSSSLAMDSDESDEEIEPKAQEEDDGSDVGRLSTIREESSIGHVEAEATDATIRRSEVSGWTYPSRTRTSVGTIDSVLASSRGHSQDWSMSSSLYDYV